MTPLFIAAVKAHMDVVRCLLDKGADINIKTDEGVSECDYTANCESLLRFCVSIVPRHPTKVFVFVLLMNA